MPGNRTARTPAPAPAPAEDADAALLARGVVRLFADLGYGALVEFPLGNRRRADVAAIHRSGEIAIAEIKTTAADYRADGKWHEYLEFCDVFYFAVPESFPTGLIPEEPGLILADRFGGTVVRAPQPRPLSAQRRRALTLRFARRAAARLAARTDPDFHG